MNCEEAYVVAALAASGDAAPADLHAFKTHAAACAACRAEAVAFEILRGQLLSLRETAAPDSAYAAMRARVVSEIDGGRRTRHWVLAWSSLAAAVCGVIAAFTLHRAAPLVAVPLPTAPVVMASIQNDEPRISPPPEPRRIRRAARRIVSREPEAPIVVHMFTSDPDVVIYWIADAKVKKSKKEIVQ